MIAWMGWEKINAGQVVDLRRMDLPIVHTTMPLGNYTADKMNIRGKTLRTQRQLSQRMTGRESKDKRKDR